ncbi:BTAD domain-containing putative transcriptional regulator [Catellatospora citrea]|uniref:BTAD domain-containing putative transcriptional regulator n=1 Tax=Catellatospora citrea TaxID=53366 RepID=UPI0014778611|nr:BTAD domain-containing putative transcriptional regulator [Catellatospora citrea]
MGRHIRERRSRAGLSQAQLAAQAAISVAGLRDLEQGRVLRPRPDTLRRLAAALHLTAAETAALIELGHDPNGDPGGLRIQVLGPLQVTVGPHPVDLGSPVRRMLLCLLALSPNTVVPRDELTEQLWGTPHAAQLLQTHVSRLRARLAGQPVRIAAAGDGYRLDVTADQLDLLAFRQAVAQARTLSAHGHRQEAVRCYRQAAEMWRGGPLADLPGLQTHPALADLARQRRTCVIEYADAGAPPEQALAVLRALAEADPLDEPVCLRLMAALVGTGQRAAALAAFQVLRRGLRDELGVDPGTELEQAHRALLGGSTGPAGRVPEQLPAAPHRFSGRRGDLARLDGLLAGWPGSAPLICTISGMAGVGKSALAVHWAHAVRDSFPDGRLYLDLRGYDPGRSAMTSGEVVRALLEALQPGGRLPHTAPALTAHYRSLIAGRRLLILLDNAHDAEQVRPVLPGAPGAMVLVTSRDQLTGLAAAEHAQPVRLDVFTGDEARSFLSHRLGEQRVAAEPAAVADIVAGCGRLPLALAVVAARAAAHPRFALAALATELRGGHGTLTALEVSDQAADVRTVFMHSYRDLKAAEAAMFRLLALHPGPEVSVAAAARLADVADTDARRTLRELSAAHLIEEPSPGRFRFHDLLRAFARELVRAEDGEPLRAAATQRMVGHYLHTAAAGTLLLAPRRDPVRLAEGSAGQRLADHQQAREWFRTEYPVLLAVADIADGPYLWQLAWALITYQDRAGHWQDWAELQGKALRAAERRGDTLGAAHSQRGLGRALAWLGRPDARVPLHRAIELFAELGDVASLGHLQLDLSVVEEHQGRADLALRHAERGVALFEQAGHQAGLANALNNICVQLAELGRHDDGVRYGLRALALLRELGDRRGEAATYDSLGVAYLQLGDHTRALADFAQAYRLFEEVGDRPGCGDVLLHLGDAHRAAGAEGDAAAAWRAALTIFEELDLADAEKALQRLAVPVA